MSGTEFEIKTIYREEGPNAHIHFAQEFVKFPHKFYSGI